MRVLFAFIFLALLVPGSMAQSDVEKPQRTPLRLRVLESQEVDFGNRSIFYNRVETPVLKARPKPRQAPVEPPRAPTPEELEQIRIGESKRDVTLFLSSTVYDRDVTYVRWQREDGEYVLWSSIDFNYLRGLMTFETPESRYSVFLGIGNESRKQVEEWNAQAERDPELKAYSKKEGIDFRLPLPPRRIPGATPARSAYQSVSVPKTGVDPEVTRALDELHRHFDANRAQLVRDFEASEIARIAHEEWVKEHPPVPKDTTINFFPIRSVQAARPDADKSR